MARRLFLLLFSSFVGIFSGPEILMASDSFNLSGLDNTGIIETIPIIVEEQPAEATAHQAVYVEPATTYVAPAPVYVAPSNSISVAGRIINVIDVADTTVDAGDHVNKYGGRFFYGHNSAGVFGGLSSLGVGSIFSITYGGATTNYQVAKVVMYEKNTSTGRLQLNGAGSYMRQVADAKSDGVQYGVSLMTCAGQSLGHGDATHRLVIFANAI